MAAIAKVRATAITVAATTKGEITITSLALTSGPIPPAPPTGLPRLQLRPGRATALVRPQQVGLPAVLGPRGPALQGRPRGRPTPGKLAPVRGGRPRTQLPVRVGLGRQEERPRGEVQLPLIMRFPPSTLYSMCM